MRAIELDQEGQKQQMEVIFANGQEEILSQLSEECGELCQAAQKMRRVFHGTTKISMNDAQCLLEEEIADVLLLIDYVERAGMFDMKKVQEIAKEKNKRWYVRTNI